MTLHARTQALLLEADQENEEVLALCRRIAASVQVLVALRDRPEARPDADWQPSPAASEGCDREPAFSAGPRKIRYPSA